MKSARPKLGRPPMDPRKRKVRVSFTLRPSTLDILDRLGAPSRSEAVDRLANLQRKGGRRR